MKPAEDSPVACVPGRLWRMMAVSGPAAGLNLRAVATTWTRAVCNLANSRHHHALALSFLMPKLRRAGRRYSR